jgi:NAD(P)-dependent dehydrogenase (short-subunit alcohol dehydrogenase family)
MATTVVVGGTSGIGLVIATRAAARGDVVVVVGRNAASAEAAARQIGPSARGVAVDLADPGAIAGALAGIEQVDALVITAIEQAANSVAAFDVDQAVRSVTVKLVGYIEVVRVLCPRFSPRASVVLFGGLAKDRAYPGSTLVTTVNAGVTGLVRTLAVEIAPHRVNSIHPGVVGDSPRWRDVPDHPAVARTPIGRLVTMEEVAEATEFLLTNGGINGHDLVIDGGFLVT